MLVATLSSLPALPGLGTAARGIDLSVCWHPGMERNNSIAIQAGCE